MFKKYGFKRERIAQWGILHKKLCVRLRKSCLWELGLKLLKRFTGHCIKLFNLNINWNTNLSPSEFVSILMNPAQLIKTLGPMWQAVTSCVRFSKRWFVCFISLIKAAPFLGPSPQTNCTRFPLYTLVTMAFISTPTSFVRFTNSKFSASSSSSLLRWSCWKCLKIIAFTIIWILKILCN